MFSSYPVPRAPASHQRCPYVINSADATLKGLSIPVPSANEQLNSLCSVGFIGHQPRFYVGITEQ